MIRIGDDLDTIVLIPVPDDDAAVVGRLVSILEEHLDAEKEARRA